MRAGVVVFLAGSIFVEGGPAPAQEVRLPRMLESVILPGPEQDFECPECEHGCASAKTARARLARGLNPDGTPMGLAVLPPTDTDLLHNNLVIEINPATQWLGGSNTMTFRSLVDGLTLIEVSLSSEFTVTAVRVGSTGVAGFQNDARSYIVPLDRPYNAGEVFDVSIEYNGFPTGGGFGSISFNTQAGVPVVWTLSETVFAYTWWPSKENNFDKSTADMRFIVPSNLVVASNGVLQSVADLPGGRKQYHWRTLYPTTTYLYCFSATNYNRFSGSYDWGGGVMPLEFFIYPSSDTTSNRNAWLRAVDMLSVFRPIFGLYPFINEKYGIYQFPFGGGMEHQTMTGQGTFSESVTAHEAAHQWWGNMVTCKHWNDIWLNEGFATYSEALWLERKPGSTGLPALHSAMASRRPSSVNGTVYIFEPLDPTNLNRIFSTSFSYRKPAWVLHMLRRVVGDEAFFNILAAYRAAHEYGSATTEDFIAVAEAATGRSLRWFFDPWLYSPGAPAYRRAHLNVSAGGQNYVDLMVQQVQTSPYPVFTMPLDVVLTVGGVPTTRTVWNKAALQWYLIPVSAAPSSVALDPTPWVLATSNSTGAFIEGPPKIVAVSPVPGSVMGPGFAGPITVTFHKAVVASASHFSLVGDSSGPVPVNYSYDSGTRTVTLTPAGLLPNDSFTLTVSDGVIAGASSRALDGEMVDPSSPASLPSGDGIPGGAAVVRFSVQAPPPVCAGDADGDGTVDFADITSVLTNWGAVYWPATGPGDADGDGTVDFADITSVLAGFGVICPNG